MGLDASLVGKKLTPFTTVVGPRATMGYAAAIGDASPRYLDDRLETIVAPPMFAVALSWPVLGDIQRYADFPLPPEVAMAVHAREQLRFERLLRPGERVTIRGEIAALVPQRAGALVVFTLPVFDEADALVHTEHLGALLRGATLDDGGAGEERVPKLSTSDFSTPVWQQPIPTSPLLAHVYDACTEIVFGIHTSPRMAEALGLPGIILQGTATLALAVREILDREAQGEPERVRGIDCRFGAFVRPGETIQVRLLERRPQPAGTALLFEVHNEQGRRALADGCLLLDERSGP